MLLLVPALLLMVHVTSHAAIVVGTPRWGGDRPSDGAIYCGGPVLEIAITHGGFFTRDESGVIVGVDLAGRMFGRVR